LTNVRNQQLRNTSHGVAPKLELSTEIPPAPPMSEVGEAVWDFVWLNAPVRSSDKLVVERFCRLHEHRHELTKVLEQDGLMSVGSQGQPVVHPALRVIATLEPQLGRLEQVLGLSPEARTRLNVPDTFEDELSKFLTG
jgi:P27 family predicted phage terminase small subunit